MAELAVNPLLYLWKQRTLFIGQLEHPLDISTGAATIMFALNKPIKFMTNEMSKPIECKSLLLPAGIPVIIDTQESYIANCTLDPLGEDFCLLSERTGKQIGKAFYNVDNENHYITKFLDLCSAPLNAQENLHSLNRLLRLDENIGCRSSHVIDPRIVSVIKMIQDTIAENLSLSDLAATANLSQSRLIELFKLQTGLPVRRYRLWYRLYKTTEGVGEGKSLTEAAVEAGFADSSHFNKTFRSMLGMTPSCIFTQTRQLQVILPGSECSRSTLLNVNSPLPAKAVVN